MNAVVNSKLKSKLVNSTMGCRVLVKRRPGLCSGLVHSLFMSIFTDTKLDVSDVLEIGSGQGLVVPVSRVL